ncbi:MAG: hypothetical protein U0174_28250 [Polyangiaceae bacterium]
MVDLVFLCVLIGVTVFATIAVLVRAKLQRAEKQMTTRAFEGFARTHLAPTDAPRSASRRASFKGDAGHLGELPTREPVRLLALGNEGVKYTIMEAQLPDAICARLVCTTEKKQARRGKQNGGASPKAKLASVSIAPMFDQVFRTETTPAALARRALTTEMQRGLVAFSMGQPLRFAYDKGWLSLKWPGHEHNDARLEEALRLLTLAAASFRRVYAPEPSAEPVALQA